MKISQSILQKVNNPTKEESERFKNIMRKYSKRKQMDKDKLNRENK